MLKKILGVSLCIALGSSVNAASSSSSSSYSSSLIAEPKGIIAEYFEIMQLFSEEPTYHEFCINFGLNPDATFEDHCIAHQEEVALAHEQRFVRFFCLAAADARRKSNAEKCLTFLKNLILLLKLNYCDSSYFAAFKDYITPQEELYPIIDALSQGSEELLLEKLETEVSRRRRACKSDRRTLSLIAMDDSSSSGFSSSSSHLVGMRLPNHRKYSGIDPRRKGFVVERCAEVEKSSETGSGSTPSSSSSSSSSMIVPSEDPLRTLKAQLAEIDGKAFKFLSLEELLQRLMALTIPIDIYSIASLLFLKCEKLYSNVHVRHLKFTSKLIQLCLSKKIPFGEIDALLSRSDLNSTLKNCLLIISAQEGWGALLESLWGIALQVPELSEEIDTISQLSEIVSTSSTEI